MSDWRCWITPERVERWLVGRRIVAVRNLHPTEPFDALLEDPVAVRAVGTGLGDERVT